MKDPHDIRKAAIEDEIVARSEEAYDPAKCLREEVERFKKTNTFSPMLVSNCYVQAGLVLSELSQLRSKCERLEAQCAEMRSALLERGVHRFDCPARDDENWGALSWRDGRDNSLCICELKTVLSTDCGKAILSRLEEARRLLEGAIPGMDSCPHIYQAEMWIQRRDQWLEGGQP